jgi:hypothetical protein
MSRLERKKCIHSCSESAKQVGEVIEIEGSLDNKYQSIRQKRMLLYIIGLLLSDKKPISLGLRQITAVLEGIDHDQGRFQGCASCQRYFMTAFSISATQRKILASMTAQ